jgi:hypothetical protein
MYYFSFTLFMCFFHCLEQKSILHRYGNADTALYGFILFDAFYLSPKICGHQSSEPCHLGVSGVMSVAVSATFLFTLALRGLEEPAHASSGLEELFFQLCCCVVSVFWFWREMRELALHYYFPADCFGIERKIVFGVTYVLSVQYSCAVVSVFLYYDRKKKF